MASVRTVCRQSASSASFRLASRGRTRATKAKVEARSVPASSARRADLDGVVDRTGVVRQLTALLGGEGPRAALDTICLNAAGMAVLGGIEPDWQVAFREARHALERGAALAVLERLRTCLTPG